ncbi:hypothetical protein X949_4864 [Burkholderia pseudomallei MSHR5609]|nr:hypothetical protein X949_4864 [Burkholderia pseudomallei MSHR5609]
MPKQRAGEGKLKRDWRLKFVSVDAVALVFTGFVRGLPRWRICLKHLHRVNPYSG